MILDGALNVPEGVYHVSRNRDSRQQLDGGQARGHILRHGLVNMLARSHAPDRAFLISDNGGSSFVLLFSCPFRRVKRKIKIRKARRSVG